MEEVKVGATLDLAHNAARETCVVKEVDGNYVKVEYEGTKDEEWITKAGAESAPLAKKDSAPPAAAAPEPAAPPAAPAEDPEPAKDTAPVTPAKDQAPAVDPAPAPKASAGEDSCLTVGLEMRIPKNNQICSVRILEIEENFAKVEYVGGDYEDDWVNKASLESFLVGAEVIAKSGVPSAVKAGDRVTLPKFSALEPAVVVDVLETSVLVKYDNEKLEDEWVTKAGVICAMSPVNAAVTLPPINIGAICNGPEGKMCTVQEIDGDRALVQYQDSEKQEWVNLERICSKAAVKKTKVEATASTTIHGHSMDYIRRVFNLFDDDGNGWISENDLAEAMRSLGLFVSNKEARQLLAAADMNQDGKVDFDEFVNFLRIRPKDSEDRLRAAFLRFDTDGDGTINLAELRKALTTQGEKLSNEEVDEMLKDMDTNEDGKVNFEEFVQSLLQ